MPNDPCQRPPCMSPIACTGFGYCRVRNEDPQFRGLPIDRRRAIAREDQIRGN